MVPQGLNKAQQIIYQFVSAPEETDVKLSSITDHATLDYVILQQLDLKPTIT